MKAIIPAIFSVLAFIACAPEIDQNIRCSSDTYTYPQSFRTDVAWIVLERNCFPAGWGSGFLVDRNKGAFYTNKHVSNMFNSLGRGSHKLFFNGKVYNIALVRNPLLADAALVRITDPFNPSDFPEPSKFSEESTKIGEPVLIEGFHVHPSAIRVSDEAEGFKFPVLPVFVDNYSKWKNDQGLELVFERLEGRITAVDKKIGEIQGQGSGTAQSLRGQVNSYIEVRTSKDHKFSFGGLSGTVVRNAKLETIGIFTAGPEEEFDPIAERPDGVKILQQVNKTAYITPIGAVSDLMEYLK
jgi:hypothetical protein